MSLCRDTSQPCENHRTADRTATWKRIGSDVLGLIDVYKCSNCGAHPPKKQIGVTWGWDFVDCCPKCGAKIIPATKEGE